MYECIAIPKNVELFWLVLLRLLLVVIMKRAVVVALPKGLFRSSEL